MEQQQLTPQPSSSSPFPPSPPPTTTPPVISNADRKHIPPTETDRRYLANQLSQLNTRCLQLLYRMLCEKYPDLVSINVDSSRKAGSFTVDVKNMSSGPFHDVEEFARAALGDDDEVITPINKRVKVVHVHINGPRINRSKDEDLHMIFHDIVPVTLLSHKVNTSKPWICDFDHCGKAFSVKGSLISHTARHLNTARPISAERKDRFRGREDKHVEINGIPVVLLAKEKAGDRPWQCRFESCTHTEGFRSLDKIEKHVLSHLTPTAMCRVCGRQFQSLETLEVHMMKAHPLVEPQYGGGDGDDDAAGAAATTTTTTTMSPSQEKE